MKLLSLPLLLLMGCSCVGPQLAVLPYPPTTDQGAMYAQRLSRQTVQVWQEFVGMVKVGKENKMVSLAGTGTGVVVGTRNGHSVILTAGHVVEVPDTIDTPDHQKMTVIFAILHVYTLSNEHCFARTLKKSDHPDLALVEANCIAGDTVSVGTSSPPYGAMVLDVSEATGYHPKNSYCLVDGRFLGIDDHDGDATFSIAGVGGASGSGVFYRGKLIAILTKVNTEYEHLTYGESIETVVKFLRDNVNAG